MGTRRSKDGVKMKEIVYPLSAHTWQMFDENGNAQVEVRDSLRNTVFFMRIRGREMQEAKRFREDIVPVVIDLLNENNFVPENSIGSDNDTTVKTISSTSEIVSSPVKKRGRPFGSKNRR